MGNTIGFVKVTFGDAANWQTVVVPLIVAVGVGRTVTVVEDEMDGPLQPLAVTDTVAVPEYPAPHVTVPVVPAPAIELPAPVTLQL